MNFYAYSISRTFANYILLQMVKRRICIFLLFIFAFNIVGVLVVFKVRQLIIRHEIKQNIKIGVSLDKLHIITVSKANHSELIWESDDEFRYKGDMYDIVKKEILNDSTIIYHCINDKQETELFANLDELVKKNMGKDNPVKHAAEKLFKVLSLIYLKDHISSELNELYNSGWYSMYNIHYVSPFIAIKTPPPQYFHL